MSFDEFDRKMERRLGRYAIRNLSLALIISYFFGYLMYFINADFLNYLTLNPYAIVHGQIWRLITWVIVPPSTDNLFFFLIMLLFYYSIGTALERTWGTWRYNVYIFSGLLFTIFGAFIMMGVAYFVDPGTIAAYGAGTYFANYSRYFSTYYVNMSIFLAYAVTFPDMQVLLMFIIPIRVKWLGVIYAAFLVYDVIFSNFAVRIAIIASLLNFIVLWIRSGSLRRLDPRQMKRQSDYRRGVRTGSWQRGEDGWMHASGNGKAGGDGRWKDTDDVHRTGWKKQSSGAGETGAGAQNGSGADERGRVIHHDFRQPLHRCAVCGRTELDDPNLEFRYCSKCQGNYEYCMDHIFTHIHVRTGDPTCFDKDGHVRMMPKSETKPQGE